VLVVEDERTVREALTGLLVSRGFDVAPVGTTAEGLRSLDETIDVALLDWKLGTQTAEPIVVSILRRVLPCAIVILSGGGPEDPASALSGMRSFIFLPKPFEPDELVAMCGMAAEVGRRRREARASIGPLQSVAIRPAEFLEEFLDELDSDRRLTPRRRQAAMLYLRALTAEAAADEMGIAVDTYNNHLKAVVRDLGLESRLELLRRYAELVDARRGKR
jgi:DNA-binding response OmpR family regulator